MLLVSFRIRSSLPNCAARASELRIRDTSVHFAWKCSLKIPRVEFVEALAAARIDFCRGLADPRAMPVESRQQALFIAGRGRFDPPQRVAGDQERSFHCAVGAPETDGAARRVVRAAGIGEGDAHWSSNCL